MWAKILLLAVNIKPQKLNVGKIFKYGAKNVREILNLQIQFFFGQGVTYLWFFEKCWFTMKYTVKKIDMLLAPECT